MTISIKQNTTNSQHTVHKKHGPAMEELAVFFYLFSLFLSFSFFLSLSLSLSQRWTGGRGEKEYGMHLFGVGERQGPGWLVGWLGFRSIIYLSSLLFFYSFLYVPS